MTVLSAIGDITRFPRAKHLVGYSGIGAGVHAAGMTHRGGSITREGRRELRAILVEAAWSATQSSPIWRGRLERLAARIGTGKALVALARKRLVVIGHVLTHHVPDRDAPVEAIGGRLVRWGSRYGGVGRGKQARGAFVRQQLERLGLGAAVTSLTYYGAVIALGPPTNNTR